MEAVAIESAKATRLILTGSAAMSCSANWSCETAMMARPVKVRLKKNCSTHEHRDRRHAGNQHAQRQIDDTEMPAVLDVGRLDVAVVDAEHEDQRHLRDEQDAEEEREAAQRIMPALLE